MTYAKFKQEKSVQKTVVDNQKMDNQGIADAPTKLSSVDGKHSMAANDENNPVELKHLEKKPAWVDCPFCHSRVETRVEKHVRKEDVAWNFAGIFFSLIHISNNFPGIHTSTHYCSNCEEAIAARRPGDGLAKTLDLPGARRM
ncbi:hypothetical protein J7T55_001152 [Diaporthe amygdali]|uniref:uncharacterized protein n=1 Tax=Phomopsis amygdali TaxID=1214568 RepID=UPI0022FDC0FF|nr:uncharacterized protein J7T55_001152 [Diaporthe amygdali]KAJ0120294.1 hypothetical protein J7T55_001152 [Diaporthe amygdali]